jgi:pimeloyl-ACP methyl ester carboxylesterase
VAVLVGIEAAEGDRMAAFVFIHGAGEVGWYWHLVAAALRERGHDTVAPDLPCDDDSAGLPEYADTVAAAADDGADLVAAEAAKRARGQSEARLGGPSPLRAWPDLPTRILICRDDRLFPPGFLRRVARERLGITPDEIDGGHTPALSRPPELANRLEAYAAGQGLFPTGRRRPSRPAAGQLARCRT